MKETKKVLIELPIDLYKQVALKATLEDRSVRYIINKLVEEGVNHQDECK